MTNKRITLSFTPDTLDYIYKVLAQRPYAEVVHMLADMQRQVEEQQAQAQPAPFDGHPRMEVVQ